MVPRQAGYFGKPFQAKRGVQQGDTLIFNIMVDAVVRHWRHVMNPEDLDEMVIFYADGGLLTGRDAGEVQESLNLITTAFKSVGLKMNGQKTEFMVTAGGKMAHSLS